ncbi:bifunctional enzyme CysN/CysC [Acidimicrobiaceae bacterium]|nr:bifunctional enzyme CysN/CysC [Acidimicrobiaceae bacterium]
MSWFEGPTLLHHLENVYIASDDNRIDTRFPVQYVIRPQRADTPDYRGYAGRVAGGMLRVGDDIMVLPSGLTSTITGIDSPDGAVEQAEPGQAITVLLKDDLSITRGDMLCRPNNRPRTSQELEAMLCWMDDAAHCNSTRFYTVKQTTKLARGKVSSVLYRLDISNLHRETGVNELKFNEIGRVTLHTTSPLFLTITTRTALPDHLSLLTNHQDKQSLLACCSHRDLDRQFRQMTKSNNPNKPSEAIWHEPGVTRARRWNKHGLVAQRSG